MNKAYLLLGGNLGDKIANFNAATRSIESQIGKIILKSSLYETAPWGITDTHNFLNQVILVETTQLPEELLKEILSIEQQMGRKRDKSQWNDRLIDIDILFFNEQIIKKDQLMIPHPRLHERQFTLVPLNEIAENFIHPLFHKTIGELLQSCKDPLAVKLLT